MFKPAYRLYRQMGKNEKTEIAFTGDLDKLFAMDELTEREGNSGKGIYLPGRKLINSYVLDKESIQETINHMVKFRQTVRSQNMGIIAWYYMAVESDPYWRNDDSLDWSVVYYTIEIVLIEFPEGEI